MKFKLGDRLYNLGFLTGATEEEWRLRYTDTEGIVFTTLDEVDVINKHGDPTGQKTCQWEDVFTVATGEDARALWETLKRVLVSENLAIDVDLFMANVAGHDEAMDAARLALIEEQRLKAEATRDKVRELSGLTLAQVMAKQRGEVSAIDRGPRMVLPPFGGGTN